LPSHRLKLTCDASRRPSPSPLVSRGGWIDARLVVVFSLHATKKLLDRVKQPAMPPVVEPTTALGNWYGTALFWKPQVALLVNERTLFPVLMPLSPAGTLIARFPNALQQTLKAHGTRADFIEAELAAMADGRYAKTASRSVIGIMNEFSYLAAVYRDHRELTDLLALSLLLSETPCGPLYKRHGSPDRELDAAVAEWSKAVTR
jgi:Domain of unknown function (DUF6933)